MPDASFALSYGDGGMVVTHEGGDAVTAVQIRLRSGGGTTARWSDVTARGPTESVGPGDRVVLAASTAGWGTAVDPGERITVEYVVDGEAAGTLGEGTAPRRTETVDGIEVWAWGRCASALPGVTDGYEQETGSTVTVTGRSERLLTDQFESAIRSGSGAPGGE